MPISLPPAPRLREAGARAAHAVPQVRTHRSPKRVSSEAPFSGVGSITIIADTPYASGPSDIGVAAWPRNAPGPPRASPGQLALEQPAGVMRSEERREGKECVRTCRSRGEPYN